MNTKINATENQLSIVIEQQPMTNVNLLPTTNFPTISIKEAEALVYNTKDRSVYANRRIDMKRVNELMNSLCVPLSLKLMSPILINTRNQHVIDGQHRIIAISRLVNDGRLPKNVRINAFMDNLTDEEELNILIEKNSKSHNWCETDYISLELYNGNESILKMKKFAESFPSLCINDRQKISWRVTSYILNYKLPKKQDSYNIKQEYYENNPLTDEIIAEGEKFAKEILNIHKLLNYPIDLNYLRAISCVWREVRQQYPYAIWMHKVKNYAKKSSNRTEMKNILSEPTKICAWKTLFKAIRCEE